MEAHARVGAFLFFFPSLLSHRPLRRDAVRVSHDCSVTALKNSKLTQQDGRGKTTANLV